MWLGGLALNLLKFPSTTRQTFHLFRLDFINGAFWRPPDLQVQFFVWIRERMFMHKNNSFQPKPESGRTNKTSSIVSETYQLSLVELTKPVYYVWKLPPLSGRHEQNLDVVADFSELGHINTFCQDNYKIITRDWIIIASPRYRITLVSPGAEV